MPVRTRKTRTKEVVAPVPTAPVVQAPPPISAPTAKVLRSQAVPNRLSRSLEKKTTVSHALPIPVIITASQEPHHLSQSPDDVIDLDLPPLAVPDLQNIDCSLWTQKVLSDYFRRSGADRLTAKDPHLEDIDVKNFEPFGPGMCLKFPCCFRDFKEHKHILQWVKYTDLIRNPDYVKLMKERGFDYQQVFYERSLARTNKATEEEEDDAEVSDGMEDGIAPPTEKEKTRKKSSSSKKTTKKRGEIKASATGSLEPREDWPVIIHRPQPASADIDSQ